MGVEARKHQVLQIPLLFGRYGDEKTEGGRSVKKIKRILDWIVLLLTGQGSIAEEAADAGIVDYSGQGRDEKGGQQ